MMFGSLVVLSIAISPYAFAQSSNWAREAEGSYFTCLERNIRGPRPRDAVEMEASIARTLNACESFLEGAAVASAPTGNEATRATIAVNLRAQGRNHVAERMGR
jgi:hypothetical protein